MTLLTELLQLIYFLNWFIIVKFIVIQWALNFTKRKHQSTSKIMRFYAVRIFSVRIFESKAYANDPKTIDELKNNVTAAIDEIEPQLCENVAENWVKRFGIVEKSWGKRSNDIAFHNRTVEVNKAVSVKTVSFVENNASFTKMLFIIQNVFIKHTILLYITLLKYSYYNVFLF